MSSSPNLSKIEFWAMGTNVSADIVQDEHHSKEETEKALGEVRKIFENNERIFSRFKADSELSKLNARLGIEITISDEMLEILNLCLEYYKTSSGYFDPRIIGNLEKIGYDKSFKGNDFNAIGNIEMPLDKSEGSLDEYIFLNKDKKIVRLKKRIDVAGVVKGYTVDKAADHLSKKGFKNFIVEAGGDIFAEGVDEKGESWRIDIEGVNKEKVMLSLKSKGVATSGIGRRRWMRGGKKVHHLINPKDPENFSHELKAVTAIAEKTAEADAMAKTLFLMGKEKGIKYAGQKQIKALFLDYKGNVYLSERMKENLIK